MPAHEAIFDEIERVQGRGPNTSGADAGRLVEWLEHPSAEVRAAAAEAAAGVAQMPELLRALEGRCRLEPDPRVRARCLMALAQACASELETEPPGGIRHSAAARCRAAIRLFSAIAQDDHHDLTVRAAAVGALGCLGSQPEARRALAAFLVHPEPALRAAAVGAIGDGLLPTGLEGAVVAALEDPDPDVRRAALLACGRARLQDAVPVAGALLESADPRLRGAAIVAFAALGPAEEAEERITAFARAVDPDEPGSAELANDLVEADMILQERQGIVWYEAPTEDAAAPGRTTHAGARPTRAARQAASAKVGRNDPCPCGSGRKYKRCCGR